MRRIGFIFLIILGLFMTGCSKKEEVKRIPPEVNVSREAFDVLEEARKAYEARDDEKLAELATSRGYEQIKKEMKPFESVRLSFSPRWVEVKPESVIVNVQWEGTWTVNAKETAERGMGVFELAGKPLKLDRILKGSPFAQPR